MRILNAKGNKLGSMRIFIQGQETKLRIAEITKEIMVITSNFILADGSYLKTRDKKGFSVTE